MRLPVRFRGDPEAIADLESGHSSVRSTFNEMCPPEVLGEIAIDWTFLRSAPVELLEVPGRLHPLLVRHDPQWVFFNWTQNQWYFRGSTNIVIEPGRGRWAFFSGNRVAPWNSGSWYAVGQNYILKQQAILAEANYNAKLANPARVGIVPAGASDGEAQSFLAGIAQWGLNTVFALKPGMDLKLLESNGRGYEAFKQTYERCDREISPAWPARP